jgi:uncharacterized protein with beta-barrel porin domain
LIILEIKGGFHTGVKLCRSEGGGKAVVECVDEDDAAVLELPGLLSVNGSLPNAMFTVNDATLGGSGTIDGFTGTGRLTVAPGNSIGTLTSNGNVAF